MLVPRWSSILAHFLIRITVVFDFSAFPVRASVHCCFGILVEMVTTCAACMWVICASPASLGVCPYACSVIHIFTRVAYLFCARLEYCTHTHSTPLATTYLCRSVTVFAVKTLTRVRVFTSFKVTGLLRSSFHQGLTSKIKCLFSESKPLQEATPLSLLCQVNSIFSLHSFR